MKLTILGGGLSAISAAYYLQDKEEIEKITIIEKDDKLGGLCRSYDTQGILYDVGPHIIFSKNKEILQLMQDSLQDNKGQIRRSNRILHEKRFIQYPFENDLSKLPEGDLKYCLNAFLNNPYEDYEKADNMLQFFLKNFGEGITNTYLRPYNEKIWKFDPSYMDTQMVDRIPKPPREDIIRSAKGDTVDGYTHQLHFTYPKQGGINSMFNAFVDKLGSKVEFATNQEIDFVNKDGKEFIVKTKEDREFRSDRLISTIPVNMLTKYYQKSSQEISKTASDLKYNSIIIAIVNVDVDKAGDNFAFMIADKKVIFHRLSKLDFLGESYSKPNSATYMIEITYRKDDLVDKSSDQELTNEIVSGLQKIGFINSADNVNFSSIKRFEYAYVIYDLNHKKNMDDINKFFDSQGIYLNGRFGSFLYMNMDAIIEQSLNLSKKFK